MNDVSVLDAAIELIKKAHDEKPDNQNVAPVAR